MDNEEQEIDIDTFLTTYKEKAKAEEAPAEQDVVEEDIVDVAEPEGYSTVDTLVEEQPPAKTGMNRPGDPMQIENLNEIPRSLFGWNLAATFFQFGQAAALFYLAYQAETKWFFYTNFPLGFDEREGNEDIFGIPNPEQIAGFSVTWYSAVFLLLSGIDHFATIIPGLNSLYRHYIARSQNPFRWIEYSLSASLMRVMIAQLSGVTDIHTLGAVFMLTATTMLFGWAHESQNAKARSDGFRQNWFPFWASWVPHLSSWAIIFSYFFTTVSRGSPPAFVWAIVIALFVLDATFAILFYLQWAKVGPFRNYVTGEIGFVVLSFTAKSLLAWLNYGGGSR